MTTRIFIAAVLLGCGGQVELGDAGQDATSPKDGGDGASFPDVGFADSPIDAQPKGPCPTSPPTVGASCAGAGTGLECEYGSSWYVACDAVYVCTSTGTWGAQSPGFCPDAGGATCPALDAGMTCSSQADPCDYADRHCECAQTCGGPCCGGVAWECYVPAKEGCPYPRPDLGTACTNEGQACQYGTCCNGSLLLCGGGLWRRGSCIPPP